MNLANVTAVLLCAFASLSRGQVQPLEDAPSVLRLTSGDEVRVMEIFRTSILETDEAALVLRYPAADADDDCGSKIKEVWAAFRPIVEGENVSVGVIFEDSGSGGATWIWKRDENGNWATLENEDSGRTVNGLHTPDLSSVAKHAQAIVHLRLVFNPAIVVDPRYPNVSQRTVHEILLVKTLKRTAGFLGEQAFEEACSAWRPGEKWPSLRASAGHVDYLVLKTLPVGDFNDRTSIPAGTHLIEVTEAVLRNVERALDSAPESTPAIR